MSVFELVLLVIAGLLLIMAAMLSVFAASELTKTSGYKNDAKLKSSHKWLTWSSVVAWVGIVILLIMLIVYIDQASKAQSGDMSSTWGVRLFLFFTLAILIAAGVMAALGAIDIQNSKNVAEVKKTGAQNNAIAATVLMLAGAGLIIIAFIASLFNKGPKKEEDVGSEKKSKAEKGESPGGILHIGSTGKSAELEELIEKDPELLLA